MNDEQIKYHLNRAKYFISEGKKLHAVQQLHLLMDETELDEVRFILADLYEDMNFVNSGVKILSAYIEDFPENNDAKLFLAQYLMRNTLWFEAIEVLEKIPENNDAANFLIGYGYYMLKEFNLAEEYFTRFIALKEKSELKDEAKFYLAKIEYELSNYQSALNFAKDAEYLYSDHWELNLTLAKVYFKLEMYSHAITPIHKALKLNSKEASVKEWAGKIYFHLEDFKKACKFFSECIELSSEVTAEIYTYLAKSFLKLKKLEDAQIFFGIALQIDPDYLPAIEGKQILNR